MRHLVVTARHATQGYLTLILSLGAAGSPAHPLTYSSSRSCGHHRAADHSPEGDKLDREGAAGKRSNLSEEDHGQRGMRPISGCMARLKRRGA